MEYMKDYPLSANPFFPSLETLRIDTVPDLKGWGMRDIAAQQAPSYPHLQHLNLKNITRELCFHLMCLSSSLKSLEISGIEDVISLPEELQHLSTIQTLTI